MFYQYDRRLHYSALADKRCFAIFRGIDFATAVLILWGEQPWHDACFLSRVPLLLRLNCLHERLTQELEARRGN
jgi:hypothetical protein